MTEVLTGREAYGVGEPRAVPRSTSLITRTAERFGVEPTRLMDTLKSTAFKAGKDQPAVTNEQMMALLIVAEQYHLNPFTKELFAFADKNGGIVPFVSVDGWSRIINEHAQFDGMEFKLADDLTWCSCTIWRKDRAHSMQVVEYMVECKRGTAPWSTHPRRMLRHKAMIQCARLAFGFALYDEDEARRIIDGGDITERPSASASAVRKLLAGAGGAPSGAGGGPIESGATEGLVAQVSPAPLDDEPGFGTSLEQYTNEVMLAASIEDAQLIVDEARSALPSSQHAELVAFYRGRWANPEEQTE